MEDMDSQIFYNNILSFGCTWLCNNNPLNLIISSHFCVFREILLSSSGRGLFNLISFISSTCLLLLLCTFRSTRGNHHDNILSTSRRFVSVLSQVILINFQASLLASTLFTYLRDAIIIITKLFPVVVVIIVIVFFITSIGNTLVWSCDSTHFLGTFIACSWTSWHVLNINSFLTLATSNLLIYSITTNNTDNTLARLCLWLTCS